MTERSSLGGCACMEAKGNYKEEARDAIRQMIDRLKTRGRKQLPSEKQLAQKLRISRETVRSILHGLEYEGRIFRIQGSGTFINLRSNHGCLIYPCEDYGDGIRRSGRAADARTLPARTAKADDRIRNALQMSGSSAVCVPLVMFADRIPCILVLYYFDKDVVPSPPVEYFNDINNDIKDMMDMVCRNRGTLLLWDNLEMYALPSDKLGKEYHSIFGGHLPPCFYVQDSLFFDTEHFPICYSRSFIDTSDMHFYMIRRWR